LAVGRKRHNSEWSGGLVSVGNANKELRDFKKYTSYKLIHAIKNNLKESKKEWMLWMFQRAGSKNVCNEKYQFWQNGYHPIELDTVFVISIGVGGVYDGQPIIKLDGKEYVKTNGTFVEYEPGKWGGTSTFFPKEWSDARIIEEVEYAVENNHGLVEESSSLYYGFSKDGIIEIRFAFNSNGKGTYYAIKK